MNNKAMVERFEEAFLAGMNRENPFVSSALHRGFDGEYFNMNTRMAFNWYVKGAASVVVELPSYHYEGMGCGIEDRGITDRYEACQYGFEDALERAALAIEAAGGTVKS